MQSPQFEPRQVVPGKLPALDAVAELERLQLILPSQYKRVTALQNKQSSQIWALVGAAKESDVPRETVRAGAASIGTWSKEEWSKLQGELAPQGEQWRAAFRTFLTRLEAKYPQIKVGVEGLVLALDEIVNNTLEHSLLGRRSSFAGGSPTDARRLIGSLRPSRDGACIHLSLEYHRSDQSYHLAVRQFPVSNLSRADFDASWNQAQGIPDFEKERGRGMFLIRAELPEGEFDGTTLTFRRRIQVA